MKKSHIDIIQFIRRLEIIIKILMQTRITSRYRSVFRGKGLEFEDYRIYTPQDDAHFIDWKASMRSNQLLMKEFVEERELNTFFLFDVSSSMLFGSTQKLKNEYAIELIASLAYFILHARDKVGLLLFNNKIVNVLYPSWGENQFYAIIDVLLNPKFYGGRYNLTQAVKFMMDIMKERGLIFIISDFIGLENNWEKPIKAAAAKSDVVGIMIRDPRDEKLPKDVGRVLVADPFSNRNILINTAAVKEKYESYVRYKERKIRESFLKSNADFIHLSTAESFIPPIVEFLKRRERLLFR